jgi:hypothetical protein
MSLRDWREGDAIRAHEIFPLLAKFRETQEILTELLENHAAYLPRLERMQDLLAEAITEFDVLLRAKTHTENVAAIVVESERHHAAMSEILTRPRSVTHADLLREGVATPEDDGDSMNTLRRLADEEEKEK